MIPKYCQKVYAALWNRFGEEKFSSRDLTFLEVFTSKNMVKKILHVLTRDGWIERIERGSYVCVTPEDVFKQFFKPKMMDILNKINLEWCFTGLNALEVYSDFSVCHRSWLSNPYHIKVLRKDLEKWEKVFQENDIPLSVGEGRPRLGEYVILYPEEKLRHKVVNGYRVEPLGEALKFCEDHIYEFGHEYDYLREKYGGSLRRA